MKELQEDKYFTVKEFAQLVGVHEVTVRKWLMSEKIHAVKFGTRCVRIPASELERCYTRELKAE